jgi:hypothetical protein
MHLSAEVTVDAGCGIDLPTQKIRMVRSALAFIMFEVTERAA